MNDNVMYNQDMTLQEQDRLTELESTIERGLQTFYEVGSALLEIRDTKLYRQDYGTFDEYCRDRWSFSSRNANYMMNASKIIDNLESNFGRALPKPSSVAETVPLVALETPELQREAWQRAVETAHDGKVTGAHVQRVVNEMRGINRVPQFEPPYYLDFEPDDLDEEFEDRRDTQPPAQSSKPMHTDNIPVSTQWHNKLMWNYRCMDFSQFYYFTIGYSQRSIEQVCELLEIANVGVLIDSRYTPHSQYKPEFSKSNLEAHFKNHRTIDYVHIPEFGIAPENRSDLHLSHDYDSLWASYDKHLDSLVNTSEYGGVWDYLRIVYDIDLEMETVAFMCLELDPSTCHRHRIARYLTNADDNETRVFDL